MIGREKPGEQSEVAQLIQQTLEQERWQREMMEQRYNQYMEEQEVGGVTQHQPISALPQLLRSAGTTTIKTNRYLSKLSPINQ